MEKKNLIALTPFFLKVHVFINLINAFSVQFFLVTLFLFVDLYELKQSSIDSLPLLNLPDVKQSKQLKRCLSKDTV